MTDRNNGRILINSTEKQEIKVCLVPLHHRAVFMYSLWI